MPKYLSDLGSKISISVISSLWSEINIVQSMVLSYKSNAICHEDTLFSYLPCSSFPGWPSFYDVISPDAITFNDDFSYGMHRIEISCSQVSL